MERPGWARPRTADSGHGAGGLTRVTQIRAVSERGDRSRAGP